MTSLPTPAIWNEALPGTSCLSQIGNGATEDERSLRRAFHSFAEAAASLESSYDTLREDVERLRCELAQSNSELSRTSEENRSMRSYLDRILERLPCGVLVVSSDGKLAKINPEALRLVTAEAPDCADVLEGDTRAFELPSRVRLLLERSRQEEEKEPEVSLETAGKETRWLTARYAAIDEKAGGASSLFILRDITERKRYEETESRRRRDQALAEVAALLAHEIRNPLGSLELFAGLLAESTSGGEHRDWIDHVQAGLRTLSATVSNVLQFHSMPEPMRVPVDLGALLEWARDFFAPLARQSQVTISLQNRLTGVLFLVDRHRLEQVLLNLVLNSLRALKHGGWIELGGRKHSNGDIIVAVSDTGPGICPEDLPHLFEPGFSRGGSLGLGLAVCRKIVEQHRGSISASNREGGGAVFTVTFQNQPGEENNE